MIQRVSDINVYRALLSKKDLVFLQNYDYERVFFYSYTVFHAFLDYQSFFSHVTQLSNKRCFHLMANSVTLCSANIEQINKTDIFSVNKRRQPLKVLSNPIAFCDGNAWKKARQRYLNGSFLFQVVYN